jgi:chorismate mutase
MPIESLRAEISRIDEEIIELIARRQRLAGRIAHVKMNEGLPIHDKERTKEVLDSAFESSVEKNINPVYVQQVFQILIKMSEERQRECSGDGNLP